MPDPADMIWIVDAMREYNRSRGWLDKQIDEGRLHTISIPGDRRLYLLRSELDRLLRPQMTQHTND